MGAEWNDELPEEGVLTGCLATGKSRKLQHLDCRLDCIKCALCGIDVPFEQEVVKPQQIVFGFEREPDLIALH
jgi:hypothetical protein